MAEKGFPVGRIPHFTVTVFNRPKPEGFGQGSLVAAHGYGSMLLTFELPNKFPNGGRGRIQISCSLLEQDIR